jgi:hypothetical protein
MTDKHTPGPLTITGPSPGLVRGIDDGGDFAIVDVNGHVIGQAHRLVAPSTLMPAKANATLWAAAPGTLKALEHVRTTLDNIIGDNELLERYLPLLLQDVSTAIKATKGDA